MAGNGLVWSGLPRLRFVSPLGATAWLPSEIIKLLELYMHLLKGTIDHAPTQE